MKAEQLKVIAEGMGYEVAYINTIGAVFIHGKLPSRYNPLTNNDQMVEIIEKLARDDSLEIKITIGCKPLVTYNFADYYIGKTINEAVCNAAYEYFNKESVVLADYIFDTPHHIKRDEGCQAIEEDFWGCWAKRISDNRSFYGQGDTQEEATEALKQNILDPNYNPTMATPK